MIADNRSPSTVFDSYWIYAFNQANNYKIPKKESGKWLIFDHIDDIDSTWEKLREATRSGLLGNNSKVSTAKINPNAFHNDYKVICVFTSDYSNKADVLRIEKNLRSIGIINKLTYKLDRDIGKYEKHGHKNLDQHISYSKKYYEVLNTLNNTNGNQQIELIGYNDQGFKKYRFHKNDMEQDAFKREMILFAKLGFQIDYHENNDNRTFNFLVESF